MALVTKKWSVRLVSTKVKSLPFMPSLFQPRLKVLRVGLYLVLFIVSLIIFFTIKAIKNVELKNVQNSLIASFTVIENISTPYLNSYLNNKVIVDFNSINSDGFARIPSILLQAMLDVGVQQQRLEKIKLPQKGITLYKSLTPNIDTSKLVSTTLDIS